MHCSLDSGFSLLNLDKKSLRQLRSQKLQPAVNSSVVVREPVAHQNEAAVCQNAAAANQREDDENSLTRSHREQDESSLTKSHHVALQIRAVARQPEWICHQSAKSILKLVQIDVAHVVVLVEIKSIPTNLAAAKTFVAKGPTIQR
jgi:hypothetical protein